GPGWKTNPAVLRSKTLIPTTSAGSRSLVNWTRLKPSPRAAESACASVVFPTPGRSSISRCPRARMQASARRIWACFPTTILPTWLATDWIFWSIRETFQGNPVNGVMSGGRCPAGGSGRRSWPTVGVPGRPAVGRRCRGAARPQGVDDECDERERGAPGRCAPRGPGPHPDNEPPGAVQCAVGGPDGRAGGGVAGGRRRRVGPGRGDRRQRQGVLRRPRPARDACRAGHGLLPHAVRPLLAADDDDPAPAPAGDRPRAGHRHGRGLPARGDVRPGGRGGYRPVRRLRGQPRAVLLDA